MDNEDFDNENEVEELCPEHKGKAVDAFCVVVFAMLNIIDRVRGYGEMY